MTEPSTATRRMQTMMATMITPLLSEVFSSGRDKGRSLRVPPRCSPSSPPVSISESPSPGRHRGDSPSRCLPGSPAPRGAGHGAEPSRRLPRPCRSRWRRGLPAWQGERSSRGSQGHGSAGGRLPKRRAVPQGGGLTQQLDVLLADPQRVGDPAHGPGPQQVVAHAHRQVAGDVLVLHVLVGLRGGRAARGSAPRGRAQHPGDAAARIRPPPQPPARLSPSR